MGVLRKVLHGSDLIKIMDVPENFKKIEVEIIIIPLDEKKINHIELKRPGALKEYARRDLIQIEKTAWEMAVREKNENS